MHHIAEGRNKNKDISIRPIGRQENGIVAIVKQAETSFTWKTAVVLVQRNEDEHDEV